MQVDVSVKARPYSETRRLSLPEVKISCSLAAFGKVLPHAPTRGRRRRRSRQEQDRRLRPCRNNQLSPQRYYI